MIITFKSYLTSKGTEFDTKTFDNNIESIKAFFERKAEIDIKVLDSFGECEADAVAIRCMMDDVMKESSYIFRALSSVIEAENIIDLKVKMLKYLLERYFPCVHNYTAKFNSDDYAQYSSYYYEENFLYFKYLLPCDLIEKCCEKMPGNEYLDLSKLSVDELATCVIPLYYKEIGWYDRESIRNDKRLMDFLSITWFMQAKHGRLD